MIPQRAYPFFFELNVKIVKEHTMPRRNANRPSRRVIRAQEHMMTRPSYNLSMQSKISVQCFEASF